MTTCITTQDQQSKDLPPAEIVVSYSESIFKTQTSPRTFESIVEEIRSSETLRNSISSLRTIPDQTARQKFKERNLPWMSFSQYRDGIRLNDNFLSTEFMVIDLDHLGHLLEEIRSRLKQDPRVFSSFLSPGGDGIKVVFVLDAPITNVEDFRAKHREIQALVKTEYGIEPDTDDDPARATYLSSDPDIHVNTSATRISGIVIQDQPQAQPPKPVLDLLPAFSGSTSPGRTNALTRITGSLIAVGYREAYAIEFLKLWDQAKNTPPLGDQKVLSTVRDMYKRYWNGGFSAKLDRYYSYQTDLYDVGVVGEQFFLEKISLKKFFILSGASDDETQEKYLQYVVKEKHIRHLQSIDHEGDIQAGRSFVKFLPDAGIFQVHYAPLPVRIHDNTFIESWLKDTFVEHADFIKQWLAVYSYTNYRKLPTLVLKGDRGTGKNTFAEAVLSIYPSISQFWHGEEKNFTPEVQKKLLIADESVSANEKQYRMLKQRSGQKMSVVNQKYLPEYQVRNNMNIIILSNEATPIFVQKDEQPTSERNNQFFVYTLPKLKGEIDPDFGEKIEERLGHYIRSELKDVYETVKNIAGCRYSIPTPITDEERMLFNVNQTGLEEEGMKFLRRMVEQGGEGYAEFFSSGLFPSAFIDGYSVSHGYTKNGVIRNLKEKGYLKATDPARKMVGGKREYCFEMTDKMKSWYKKERVAQ